MPAIFWRVIIAVICVLAFYALLPPLSRVLRMPVSADVQTIFTICVAAIAVFYIIKGRPLTP